MFNMEEPPPRALQPKNQKNTLLLKVQLYISGGLPIDSLLFKGKIQFRMLSHLNFSILLRNVMT